VLVVVPASDVAEPLSGDCPSLMVAASQTPGEILGLDHDLPTRRSEDAVLSPT